MRGGRDSHGIGSRLLEPGPGSLLSLTVLLLQPSNILSGSSSSQLLS